jgi:hypothetical protein
VKPDSASRQAAEHVKKQEQPQTHKDGEAQKLVDRIEKKVDDQREKSIREDAGQASAARLNLRDSLNKYVSDRASLVPQEMVG